MINPIKWLVCWWHERHVAIRVHRGDKAHTMCIRCGQRWQR